MTQLLFHFGVAFFATIAFGIVFYAPPKTLPCSALTGACGYIAYYIMSNYMVNSEIMGCVLGGVIIALMSEFFAFIQKNPVTAYEMPAIMPLVPGIGLYRTMISFLEKNTIEGVNYLFQTILCAGSIAIGLILTEAAAQVWLRKNTKAEEKAENNT
ncbi:MAG: threonine/serine exporter family protein [Clostridiales bacterium]|nr:threonine/serine exporter family protein [Clostridiales bacterium]